MPRPLSPWIVQPFSVNARLACEHAITNLDNGQRPLSNLLIARTRVRAPRTTTNTTNYAPKVTQRAMHQKYETVNTILNTTAKKRLSTPTYFYNSAPRSVPAPRSSPLHRFSAAPAHRSAPLHPIFGWLRSALRSDNKVQNIQN